MRAQFIQEKNDNLKGMIYVEGHTLDAETAELYGNKHGAKTSCKCGVYTHQRIIHNLCQFNMKKQKLK